MSCGWKLRITKLGIIYSFGMEFMRNAKTGQSKDKTWLLAEKDKFDHELDSEPADGQLNAREILNWVLPSNE